MRAFLTTALWLTACGSLFCVVCTSSNAPVAGGGSSETVIGMVVDSSGHPSVQAFVRLRSSDYVTTVPALAKSALYGADALTDDSGRFEITGVDPGSYRIEVTDGHAAVLLACSLDVRDTVNLGVDTLRPFATISGTIDTAGRAGQRAYVQVEGLERLAAVNDSGRFVITDLPAGNFTVRAVTAQDTTIAAASNVIVGPGERTDVTMLSGWRFSKRLYLNTTTTGANVNEDVTGFPLLVRLASTPLSNPGSIEFDFTQARDSAQDLRFTKADGSMLPYEIEQWNRASRQAAIWVRMDTVYGNNDRQFIDMQWGASTGSAPVSMSNGAAVFDTADGCRAVYHLGERSAVIRHDATADGYDAAAQKFDLSEPAPGVAGMSDSLSNGKYLIAGDIPLQDALTLEAWVNVANYTSWDKIFYQARDTSIAPANYRISMELDTVATRRVLFGVAAQDGQHVVASRSSIIDDQWVHLTATYDGRRIALYVNGVEEDSESVSGALVASDRAFHLANTELYSSDQLTGKIDETRISGAARSAAWVKLCYENQKPDQHVVTAR